MSRRHERRDDRRQDGDEREDDKVRIDKWLWAARFFKTRSLAAEAIEGGKVDVNGERAKRSRALQPGDEVRVRMPPFEHVIVVRALSVRRGPASEAALLYEETEASRTARTRLAEQLRTTHVAFAYEEGKPSKRDRRELERFRDRNR